MKDTIAIWVPAFACLAMAVVLTFGAGDVDRLAIALTVLSSCFALFGSIIVKMRRELPQLQERLAVTQERPNASARDIS